MPDVIIVGKAYQHVVGNIDGFIALVDDYMGYDAARWLRKYIRDLNDEYTEEIDNIKAEYEERAEKLRNEYADFAAELEEKICT